MKYIYNKYIGKSVFVKCGKCPACQQEKANHRTMRIRLNETQGMTALFVTLTYQNKFCPYVLRSDIKANSYIPIYRDSYVRKVRVSSDYKIGFKSYDVCQHLDSLPFVSDNSFFDSSRLTHLNHYSSNKIGICYYKDVQDFFKRLRINLQRKYAVQDNFSFFSCSEYGTRTKRPHFHLLLWCPSAKVPVFRSAILESWPYDDLYRAEKSVEVAVNAASYVASYVSKSANVPEIFKTNSFRQKHSYSLGFAATSKFFSLPSLLDKIERNDLSFDYATCRDGHDTIVNLPVPKFIINRFFPKFKGYCRLTGNEVYELLSDPQRIGSYQWKKKLSLTDDESYKICLSLMNARQRSKLDPVDYAYYYQKAWQNYGNQVLKRFYENEDRLPYTELYDNISFVLAGLIPSPTLVPFIEYELKNGSFHDNPNTFPHRVNRTQHLSDLYYTKLKCRDITNLCMSASGIHV